MATANASVKMGVTGVAQFKQNMNQAKQAVKTLDAQLALSEKQFKATGDSQSYLAEKSELLKAKLESQKTVLENAQKALDDMASKGVDRASKAYQSMYQAMLQAKGAILDTEGELNGITEAGDEASNSVSEMNAQLKRVGDGVNWQNVTEGLGTITDGMQKVMKKAWQMGEAIVKATLGAGSWADELKTTAAQYEISPEQLQRMRKTANLIDTDAETILQAQDKLKKGREQQGKEYMGALAYLGIDPNGKSDLDLFWEAGDAISKLGKDEDKVTYAQRLYGKSWRELLPLFQAGRKEYDKTMESWSVVEDDQLDALGRMDDAYQKMQGEWETFKNEMLSAFAGPMEEGMNAITGLFQELNKYLDTPEGKEALGQIGETISSLITDLTQLDPKTVVAGFKQVVDDVTGALKWIQEHQSEVVGAVEAFILGWAGLETAKGVSIALQLINGIKGLTGAGTASGAAAAGTAAGTSFATGFVNAFVAVAPVLATMLGITAVALAPAVGAQKADEKKWKEDQERRLQAADEGSEENKQFIKDAANATGPKRNADGTYQTGLFGFLNMNPTDDSRNLLMQLASRQNQQRAELFGAINQYGKYTNGDYTTDLLLKYWANPNSERFDEATIDAMLQNITDALIQADKQKNQGVDETLDRMTQVLEETNETNNQGKQNSLTPADLAKFAGLPAAVASAVSRVGFTITLDGQQVAAYVDSYMGNSLMGS